MDTTDSRSTQRTTDFPTRSTSADPSQPAARWVGVVFLQGDAAAEALGLLDRAGADAAIGHLAGYDSSAETTQVALENGYVYDSPPAGVLDRTATGADGRYTLVYNPFLGYVNLLRHYEVPPDPTLSPPAARARENNTPSCHAASRRRRGAATDWFAAPSRTSPTGRGLSL